MICSEEDQQQPQQKIQLSPQDVENIQMVGASEGSDDVVVFVRFSSRSVCGSLFSLWSKCRSSSKLFIWKYLVCLFERKRWKEKKWKRIKYYDMEWY